MLHRQAVYGCGEGLTPDVAAKLTRLSERFHSRLEMQIDGRRVPLDSLIGILSVECPRGTRLTVIADGEDESAAAEAVARALEGA